MSIERKREMNSSDFEVDSDDFHYQSKLKVLKTLESVRTALSIVALLTGITILGVSADALAVYKSTHIGQDFHLPLWPDNFNVRPTVALVVGSAIVVVANAVGLLFGKVKVLRDRSVVLTTATFAAPMVALIASVIAMTYFYAVNASDEVDTVQSWSCRWRDVAMLQRPHWATLCKQSQAGLTLSVLLVPLEAIVLGVALYELGVRRSANAMSAMGFSATRRKGSAAGSSAASPEQRMGI